jgi:hypothetical protein
MYCSSCGKEIPDTSTFCQHCGKAVASAAKPTQAVKEWEYIYFSWDWKVGHGGHFPISGGSSEMGVRLQNWGEDQGKILPSLQEHLDKGWEAVSEVGPMAYLFRRYTDYLAVASFGVKLRRPRTSAMQPYQSKLIGKWQPIDAKTNGIYKLAYGLGGGMLKAVPKEYTFRNDNTYQFLRKDYYSGVYEFVNEQTIQMIPDPPTLDPASFKINWNGNNLVMNAIDQIPVEILLRKIQ